MSCFYCGKRVSLVRKRTDPDFCSDEHREKYRARTRRGMDQLLEAEERATATRRLSEGFPLRPSVFSQRGAPLENLISRYPGAPQPFSATGPRLPLSRASLPIHMPSRGRIATPAARGHLVRSTASLEFLSWKPAARPRPAIVSCRPAIRTRLRSAGIEASAHGRFSPDVAHRIRRCFAPDLASSGHLAFPQPPAGAAPLSVYSPMTLAHTPRPIAQPVALRRNNGATAAPVGLTLAVKPVRAFHATPPQFDLFANRWRKPIPGSRGCKPFRSYVGIHPVALSIPSTTSGAAALRPVKPFCEHPDIRNASLWQRMYTWEISAAPEPLMVGASAAGAIAAPLVTATAPHLRLGRIRTCTISSRVEVALHSMLPRPMLDIRDSVPRLTFPASSRTLRAQGHVRRAPQGVAHEKDRPEPAAWEMPAAVSMNARMHETARVAGARWAAGVSTSFAMRPGVIQSHRAQPRPALVAISAQAPGFPRKPDLTRFAMPEPALPGRITAPLHKPRPLPARLVRVLPERCAQLPETEPLECVLFQPGPRALRVVSTAPRPKAPVTRCVTFVPVQSFTRYTGPVVYSPARGLTPLPPAFSPCYADDLPECTGKLFAWESFHRFFERATHSTLASQPAFVRWPATHVSDLLVYAHAAIAGLGAECAAEPAPGISCSWNIPAACAMESRRLPVFCDQPVIAGAALLTMAAVPRSESVALDPGLIFNAHRRLPLRDWGQQATASVEAPQTLQEDFASGLTQWSGGTADWRQDVAGVRTGALALFMPSVDLMDYELAFFGRLGSRGLGWVFRASDAENYFALRIAAVKSGAAPGFLLERYAVIDGEEQTHLEMPLHITISKKSPCKVQMLIKGDDFSVSINEQPADHWSDDRLPLGGVGFFSEGEDRARLYWVKVSPLDDLETEESGAGLDTARLQTDFEITMGV